MPNLVNQDGAGNTFYNYITPLQKGVASNNSRQLDPLFTAAYGPIGQKWFTQGFGYFWRPTAPGLETKTEPITADWDGDYRFYLNATSDTRGQINSSVSGNVAVNPANSLSSFSFDPTDKIFAVANDFAIVFAITNNTATVVKKFVYQGWLREPSYSEGSAILGATYLHVQSGAYRCFRPTAPESASATFLSTAANSITTPPISCLTPTPGANATDIVIRDAASPYNPVGKLWNCIQLPASCNVGELWRNTGEDADGTSSAKDTYLCVMSWGTEKLGIRVWA